MKLCIPAAETAGLQSALEPHFPHAVSYQIFDTESRTHVELTPGQPAPAGQADAPIDAVICGSINHRGLQHLVQHGIRVMGTKARTVAEAIAQFERGELLDAVPLAGCGGHHAAHAGHECAGHGHGHPEAAHECCGGQGHGHGAEAHECCGGHGHGSDSGCGCHA